MASTPISPDDYLRWVQRSLNRILKLNAPTDGKDTDGYRDRVEDFEHQEHRPVNRDIDASDQNYIIKANHAHGVYTSWAARTLRAKGYVGDSLKAQVRSFQSSNGLGKDGWIGPRTETALVRITGSNPPGTGSGGPKPTGPTKPKPKPKPPTAKTMSSVVATIGRAQAARSVPAKIKPCGVWTDEKIRKFIAAALQVARRASHRLNAIDVHADPAAEWYGGLEEFWFGAFKRRKLRKVRITFEHIVNILSSPRLRVICDPDRKNYGAALPGIRKISIGDKWRNGVGGNGDEERVQTFIHEAAHIGGRTNLAENRGVYGRKLVKLELVNGGMKATRSADNFGYYAIDLELSVP